MTISIQYSTLVEALQQVAQGERSITFIEGKLDHRILSYAELYQRALRLLSEFQHAGLARGDQLILFTKDNQKFVEGFWACILGGIVPVPVAVGISDEHRAKLMRIFNKLERPSLYTASEHLQRLERFADAHDMHESFAVVEQKTVCLDKLKLHQRLAEPEQPSPTETAFIQFSSGSTSEPKGVVLNHANVMINLNALAQGAGFRADDISLSWMPLTHDLGLLGYHLSMLLANIDQCLMPTDLFSRRPVLWLEKVSELRATILTSPNFGYKHFLKALGDKRMDGVDLSCVRVILNAAEPISLALCDDFLERMGEYGFKRSAMWTVYGLAEATLIVSAPPAELAYRAVYVDRHRLRLGDVVEFVDVVHEDALGFVIEGPAVRDMEVEITDDASNQLAPNHVGLVQIRGPSVTRGYYLDDEASREVLTGDGWLDTGDLGFMTDDGELVITGRHKDIIFSNAQNYFPHDVENVALQLPELELNKVVACGVRGPGDDSDQLLLFVLFRAELSGFVGIARDVARHINEQMGLEVNHVIPVKRIPKTTSGKLQRRLLAEDFLSGEFDAAIAELEQLVDANLHHGNAHLSATEAKLKQAFDAVVEDKAIAREDNFFELGISSLNLVEIHLQIDNIWPGKVEIEDLFEYQTLAELAQVIDAKR